jgi:hypothetical protein
MTSGRDSPPAGMPGVPGVPTHEQVETAERLVGIHRPDRHGDCTNPTCAVGAHPARWPCRRWRWSAEILRRANRPVAGPQFSA